MANSVNPNTFILCYADFAFLINTNGDRKDIYTGIVSNMLEFPDKGIFSANQDRAACHFYDDNPHKLGGGKSLVTTEGREIRTFISYGLSYLPVR